MQTLEAWEQVWPFGHGRDTPDRPAELGVSTPPVAAPDRNLQHLAAYSPLLTCLPAWLSVAFKPGGNVVAGLEFGMFASITDAPVHACLGWFLVRMDGPLNECPTDRLSVRA